MVVVAGDVDANVVLEKVKKYFGDIPPGPPLTRPGPWVAKRTSTQRVVLEEHVPQARLVKAWNVPPYRFARRRSPALAASVLGTGKTSRLYRRLVHEEQIATEVEAYAWLREIGGLFVVELTAQPGQDLAALERALDEEVARLVADGPTRAELARVKAEERASFLRGIEKIGGFAASPTCSPRARSWAGARMPTGAASSVARTRARPKSAMRRAAGSTPAPP